MVFSQFQQHDLFILLPSLACVAASIWFYTRNKYLPAMALLFAGALGLRLFMAHLDPFLWDWDERFHAMVAANLMHHPLKPTLYDHPVLPYDYTSWTTNYIWVHKQPLALWQMALSYSLFGVSQFTARIPMVVEGAILVLLIYRTGALVISPKTGYLSALLYTINFYALDFCTGGEATDHIDYALVFYVSASLWAWIEYRQKKSGWWLVFIGVFAGLAVLSKWTIGLLVFAAWGMEVLLNPEERGKLKPYFNIFKAFVISILVFLPWQLYSLAHYPKETNYELQYNQSHLFHAVDGRGETVWYYLEQLAHNYGPPVPYIIGFAVVLLWRYIKRKDYKIFIFSALIIPYFLFSVVAATKMPAYCYIACLPLLLALGSLLTAVEAWVIRKKLRYSKAITGVGMLVIALLSCNFPGIAQRHTGYDPDNVYRANKVRFSAYFRTLHNIVPQGYVIFGAPKGWEVEMMYYSGNTSYAIIPDENTFTQLKSSGIKMAFINNGNLPGYVLNDKQVIEIAPMNN